VRRRIGILHLAYLSFEIYGIIADNIVRYMVFACSRGNRVQ